MGTQGVRVGFPAGSEPERLAPLTLDDLSDYRLVMPKVGTATRDAVEAAASDRGVVLQAAVNLPHVHLAGVYLAAGVGPALLDVGTAELLEGKGIVSVPIDGVDDLTHGLLSRRRDRTPAAAEFLALARQNARRAAVGPS